MNGGFFVLNKKIFNYLKNDQTIFEKDPLEKLSKQKQLSAFNHNGFWQPMDNLRDMNYLQSYGVRVSPLGKFGKIKKILEK